MITTELIAVQASKVMRDIDRVLPKVGKAYICDIVTTVIGYRSYLTLLHPEFDGFLIPSKFNHLVYGVKAEVTFQEVVSYFNGIKEVTIQISNFKTIQKL